MLPDPRLELKSKAYKVAPEVERDARDGSPFLLSLKSEVSTSDAGVEIQAVCRGAVEEVEQYPRAK